MGKRKPGDGSFPSEKRRRAEAYGPALLLMLKRTVPKDHVFFPYCAERKGKPCRNCAAVALIRKVEPHFRKRWGSS